jgi:hypothetical protein
VFFMEISFLGVVNGIALCPSISEQQVNSSHLMNHP